MCKVLTVTIPSYNVEAYLDQTLSSLAVDEVLDKIEVLIVDDGSKDKTYDIGLEYEKKYPNTFRVIHKENGGHGSTINVGIRQAKGKYFKVIDGDDWAAKDGLIQVVNFLENCNSDIVACNYINYFQNSGETTVTKFSGIPYGKETTLQEISNALYGGKLAMHAIIYKTELLQKNNIMLDEHCFYVDTEFCIYPLRFAKTITFVDTDFYVYRREREGQSMNMQSLIKNRKQHQRVMEHVYQNVIAASESEKDFAYEYAVEQVKGMLEIEFWIYFAMPYSHETKKEFKAFNDKVKNTMPRVYERKIDSKIIKMLQNSNFAMYPILKCLREFKHKLTSKKGK